jgi:hypothetical protein
MRREAHPALSEEIFIKQKKQPARRPLAPTIHHPTPPLPALPPATTQHHRRCPCHQHRHPNTTTAARHHSCTPHTHTQREGTWATTPPPQHATPTAHHHHLDFPPPELGKELWATVHTYKHTHTCTHREGGPGAPPRSATAAAGAESKLRRQVVDAAPPKSFRGADGSSRRAGAGSATTAPRPAATPHPEVRGERRGEEVGGAASTVTRWRGE